MGWAARANGSADKAKAAGYRKKKRRELWVWSRVDINRVPNSEFNIGKRKAEAA